MARMYDYALGGKDNFAADRARIDLRDEVAGDDVDEKMNAAGEWWLGGVGRKTGP